MILANTLTPAKSPPRTEENPKVWLNPSGCSRESQCSVKAPVRLCLFSLKSSHVNQLD